MDVIKMARELGKALQADEKMIRVQAASVANDSDTELIALIDRFNAMREEINQEVVKEDKDQSKVEKLDTEFRALYGEIMLKPNMIEFSQAKADADAMLSFIMEIISASANGADPYTIEQEEAACDSNCSSCKGCH